MAILMGSVGGMLFSVHSDIITPTPCFGFRVQDSWFRV